MTPANQDDIAGLPVRSSEVVFEGIHASNVAIDGIPQEGSDLIGTYNYISNNKSWNILGG